jgi:hypothetical protein
VPFSAPVKMSPKDVRKVLKSLRRTERFLAKEGPKKLVRTITWYGLQRIKQHSPVRTGRYRGGWDIAMTRGTQGAQGRIQHKWRKSKKGRTRLRAIELGTRAHTIRALKKRALAFQFKTGGKGIFTSVQHPGTRGAFARTKTFKELRRYMRRARKAFMKALRRARRKGP